MHIKISHKIISLSMALLMLITSTGLSIDMHFCSNHLKSFNFFGKAKNCFELAALKAHCKKHATSKQVTKPDCKTSNKECCHNKTLSLQADLTADTPNGDFLITFKLQDFTVAFVVVFIQKQRVELKKVFYLPYKPPQILRDIPVLIQSFLL